MVDEDIDIEKWMEIVGGSHIGQTISQERWDRIEFYRQRISSEDRAKFDFLSRKLAERENDPIVLYVFKIRWLAKSSEQLSKTVENVISDSGTDRTEEKP